MERLTEKGQYSQDYKIQAKNLNSHLVAIDAKGYITYYGQHIDKLAEYENLEEQGRLVILPCKVGDTLYRLVPNLYREYVEIKIAQFVINKNGIYFITDKGVSWSADKIGKTVFLTKSEAEQKLKEMESD